MALTASLAAQRRARIAAARLYLVCDSKPLGGPLEDVLRAAIAGGVEVVQLREKNLDDEELTALARSVGELCRRLGTLMIVNDRPAVALAAGADGVHIGQEDMAVAEARAIVGPEMLIGLSTHAPEEIERAAEADYIGVGPIHATPTKPGRPAVGLELIAHAAAYAPAPFFAIGGIDARNVEEVLRAGARRVAVVRAIAAAPDPFASALELSEAIGRHREPASAGSGHGRC